MSPLSTLRTSAGTGRSMDISADLTWCVRRIDAAGRDGSAPRPDSASCRRGFSA